MHTLFFFPFFVKIFKKSFMRHSLTHATHHHAMDGKCKIINSKKNLRILEENHAHRSHGDYGIKRMFSIPICIREQLASHSL